MSQEQKQDPYAKYRPDSTLAFLIFISLVWLLLCISAFAVRPERTTLGVKLFFGGMSVFFLSLALLFDWAKRNFLGYNLCYFLRGDKTETEVVFRPAMNIFLEREKGLVLSVPLGGWFNRPKVYLNGVKHLWQASWQEQRYGTIGLSNDRNTFWILSYRGEKYGPFPIPEVFGELCDMLRLGDQGKLRGYLMAACGESATQSGKALAQFRSNLEHLESTRAKLIQLLCEAADRLDKTQRLKYSREGNPFAQWLVTALCEFLAKEGEGRERYEVMLEKLQTSKAKPPQPPETPAAVPATTPTSPTATA